MGQNSIKSLWKGVRGRLPTVWGDVSVADRGDSLRQREPFLRKVFPDKFIPNFFISTAVKTVKLYFYEYSERRCFTNSSAIGEKT